jgi:hypothetical protein
MRIAGEGYKGVGSSARKLRAPGKRARTQHPAAVVELLIDEVRSRAAFWHEQHLLSFRIFGRESDRDP